MLFKVTLSYSSITNRWGDKTAIKITWWGKSSNHVTNTGTKLFRAAAKNEQKWKREEKKKKECEPKSSWTPLKDFVFFLNLSLYAACLTISCSASVVQSHLNPVIKSHMSLLLNAAVKKTLKLVSDPQTSHCLRVFQILDNNLDFVNYSFSEAYVSINPTRLFCILFCATLHFYFSFFRTFKSEIYSRFSKSVCPESSWKLRIYFS